VAEYVRLHLLFLSYGQADRQADIQTSVSKYRDACESKKLGMTLYVYLYESIMEFMIAPFCHFIWLNFDFEREYLMPISNLNLKHL
jgi:hypothetical protein